MFSLQQQNADEQAASPPLAAAPNPIVQTFKSGWAAEQMHQRAAVLENAPMGQEASA